MEIKNEYECTNRKLILIGGGGHCKSVLDSILAMRIYDRIGIIDSNSSISVSGVEVIGQDDDLLKLKNEGWTDAFISIGSIGFTSLRRRLYQVVKDIGFNVPFIIDPSAMIGVETKIGEGVFIGKRAIVNAGASIGNCAIVNTGAIVEHDCKIGSFSHISPGGIVCGQVIIGDDSHIGAGSVVRQGINIGANALIGVGSIVTRDIPNNVKAYGNPCKVVK